MKKIESQECIVVLDFGSQYNQLIVRRLRQVGVYAELLPHNISIETLNQKNIKGIILSGGPQSITDENRLEPADGFWEIEKPILGICYGMQLMMNIHGGKVEKAQKGEYGEVLLQIDNPKNALFEQMSDSIMWMSHQDSVFALPKCWKKIANTHNSPYAAVVSEGAVQRWGIQFHPEVSHSEQGLQLLRNFALGICECKAGWNMNDYVDILKEEIKTQVGDAHVICGLSGGVDSAVTAALLKKCIPSQLHCIYVDHGLMRAGESEEIEATFKPELGEQFHMIDASKRFLSKLSGVTDPEKKRKIIGYEFVAVFSEVAKQIDNVKFLAQGTLYTDIVESGFGGSSHTIKSHHNVGGLPEEMDLELVEPLKRLYKDEVRDLGKVLNLPDEIVQRQPFPGPGLGIRVLGEITKEKVQITQKSDAILRDEIKKSNLDQEIWQYFVALPGVQSVGVRGDQRSYLDAVVIRAICSVDGMTANVAQIPYAVLFKISRRITNEVEGVNRVLFDVTDKPPGTIEFE